MKIYRKMKFYTDRLQIGDRIKVKLKGFGKFTATVQEVKEDGYLFMFDECIAKQVVMNKKNTNEGGFEESDLCRWLNKKVLHAFPKKIRSRLAYISVPSYGQIFGHDEYYEAAVDDDLDEQFKLMKKAKNRIGERLWLYNSYKVSEIAFAIVTESGTDYYAFSSDKIGVRPIFFLVL